MRKACAAMIVSSVVLLSGCASTSKFDQPFREPALQSQQLAADAVDAAEPVIQLAGYDASDLAPTQLLPPTPSDFLAAEVDSSDVENDVSSMTLEQFQQLALENNPTIRQLSASVAQADDLRYQVGLSANPTAGYSAQQLADEGTDQHLLFLEREFVTAGKLGLNRNVMGHTAQALRWEVESQRYRVLTTVRQHYVRVLVAQRKIQLIREFQDVAERGVELARQLVQAGESPVADQLQAEVQLGQIKVELQQAEIERDAAWTMLVAEAGVPDLLISPVADSLSSEPAYQDWQQRYANLLEQSPEIRAACNWVNRAKSAYVRWQTQNTPNITGLIAGGFDNSTDSGMLNVEVSAPIPSFNQNQGNISAAYHEYCRATHELKRLRLALRSRLAETSQDYDSARVSIERYQREILPKSREMLDLAEQAYAAGELSFIQVLIVRKNYFDANLLYVEELGRLSRAEAEVDGMLLSGGLAAPPSFQLDDSLRGLSFSQQ